MTLNEALADYRMASQAYAEALSEERRLEHERHSHKHAAVLRMIGRENPATKKEFSATSAESYVELDAEYSAYLKAQRASGVHRINAETQRDIARMQALSLSTNQ